MFDDDEDDDAQSSDEYITELLERYHSSVAKGVTPFFMEDELSCLCDYFLEIQDLDQEQVMVEMGRNLYPESNFFLIRQANLLLDRELVDEAEALIGQLRDNGEQDIEFYRVHGRIQLLRGEWVKAEGYLKTTLALSGNTDALTMGILAGVYNTLGQYAEALKMANQVLMEPAEDDELRERAMLDMAMAYQEMGDIDGAISRYQQIIDEEPYNAHAWQFLGTFYNDTGLFEMALKAFDYAITIDSSISLAHYHQGLTYLNLKDVDKAYESMREGLQLNPSDPILLCGVGICHEKKGEFTEARKFFGETLAAEPTYADAWYGLGNCERNSRQFARAAEHFRKAAELDPTEENYWFSLAEVCMELRELKTAESALEKVLALNPASLGGRLLLAELYFNIGDSLNAQVVLAEGEELNADNSLFFYLQAACYLNNGLRTDALQTLQTALDLEPGGFDAFLDAAPGARRLKSFVTLINKYR
jgi:tetratricopeptide (TPR) repeat protein